VAQVGQRIDHERDLVDRVEAAGIRTAAGEDKLVVVVGVAAEEGQVPAADGAAVGDHQAQDAGVEVLQPGFVVRVDADMRQAGVDVWHGRLSLWLLVLRVLNGAAVGFARMLPLGRARFYADSISARSEHGCHRRFQCRVRTAEDASGPHAGFYRD
jgi:hypothetical protein